MNEFIFLTYVLLTSTSLLVALMIGQSALIALASLQLVLANFFVIKQITLLSLNVTASDALAVGVTLGMNLIQEFYGKREALRALGISFLCLLFSTAASLLHLTYEPSSYDAAHHCFAVILSHTPRILGASLITFAIVQTLDTWLYGVLKRKAKGRFFIVRNYASIGITHLLDTILFSFLGLYGIIEHIGSVIFFSYAIKVATLIIAVPFLTLARWFVIPLIRQNKETC